MIEVLVTVIIIAVGVLGAAALQITTLKNLSSSHSASVAAIVVEDFSERMRANPIAALAEVIRHRGPWKNIDEVEYATLDWVDWFNNRRILEPIGNIPPAEYELMYYQQLEESSEAA
jgi:transposase InsO family protein